MVSRNTSELAHDPTFGEVDPRTYPLLSCIRFTCENIGSHERAQQANQLIYTLDKLCSDAGDRRCRVHLTQRPGIDPKVAVEIHLQPLTVATNEVIDFVTRVRNRLPDLVKAGTRAGWVLVE